MTTSATDAEAKTHQAETRPVLPIPAKKHPNGPVTRARLRRTLYGFSAVWAAGLALSRSRSDKTATFGLGLVLPGGGYVHTRKPGRAAAAAGGVAASVVGWWGAGPVFLTPLAWLTSAALATRHSGADNWKHADKAVPAALGVLGLAALGTSQGLHRVRSKRGAELNRRLATVTVPAAPSPSAPPVTESSVEDLKWLRYAVELGLQPKGSWEGLDVIDQFRESAVRYQLNHISYACSLSQYTRTPAFTGYLAEAQRNTIEKMLEKRIWQYWALENLWGYFRWDQDPIKHDNVMYSGYFATQIGLYEAANHDFRYDRPGALTLRWDDQRAYEYDATSLVDAVRRQMLDNDFCAYPCEPNWIYSFCNSYGLNGALLHDRVRDKGLPEELIERFRRGFEDEFVQADGRVVLARTNLVGAKLPGRSAYFDGLLAYWLNPGLPEVAERCWWVSRDQLTHHRRGDSDVWSVPAGAWNQLDPGNYALGESAYANAATALAAREMGDEEVARGLERTLLDDTPTVESGGTRRFKSGSVYASLVHTLTRVGRHNAFRDLVCTGMPEQWRTGPVLAQAAYPEVLVAKAVSDGRDLDLVLRPGNGAVRTTLGLERLAPGRSYEVTGAVTERVEADHEGRAVLDVDLGDRREVRLRPAS